MKILSVFPEICAKWWKNAPSYNVEKSVKNATSRFSCR